MCGVGESRCGNPWRGGGTRQGAMESAKFKKELVSKLLHFYFMDQKTKVSGDAVIIMCEMIKLFVMEAAARTARQAVSEDSKAAEIDHFEKILPQLLLDF
ncbi:centromere protein X [Amblyraja radiata]|uniref:centromere protein X n=1 Tax=Amblyraja radiata TaxID=386614 RepID=UPI0014023743|nr:centromere protein X [Amblyraja radiata]